MTDSDDQCYNREKLYGEVWREPMIVVCKRYGVPSTALVKVCGELNIHRPHVGYWTQKECGKVPPQPELPEFDNPPRLLIHSPSLQPSLSDRRIDKSLNQAAKVKPEKAEPKPEPAPDTQNVKALPIDLFKEATSPIKISAWYDLIPKENILVPQAFEEAMCLVEKESLPEMAVIIPQTTENGNSYILNTLHSLQKEIANFKKYPVTYRYGRVSTHGKDLFEVDVGLTSVQRAVGILQALCNAFEKRGFGLVSEWNEQNRYGHVYVVIMGQKPAFSLTEHSVKTKGEAKPKETYVHDEYIPTGKLTLQNLSPPSEMKGQYRWSDTKKIPLEKKLNEVIIGFIIAAAWGREHEARWKKNKEDRAKEQVAREEKERLIRIEKQRIVNFEKATERWIWHQEMAAFLSAVKESYDQGSEKNKEIEKWIHWAEKYLTKHPAISEDLIHYEAGEYRETTTSSHYHQPSEEPYNYWKRPWYQRRAPR